MRRTNNVSGENDVYKTGNINWRSWYNYASEPADTHTKIMARYSGGIYRIFAQFEGPYAVSNYVFQCDIDEEGLIGNVSYIAMEFPEYQAGDIIVYDEDQGIDSDEGMMPQIWVDTPAVRTAWSNAITAKVAELWPDEPPPNSTLVPDHAGFQRLMPRPEPSYSSESSSSES